jgi:hypothetical protein
MSYDRLKAIAKYFWATFAPKTIAKQRRWLLDRAATTPIDFCNELEPHSQRDTVGNALWNELTDRALVEGCKPNVHDSFTADYLIDRRELIEDIFEPICALTGVHLPISRKNAQLLDSVDTPFAFNGWIMITLLSQERNRNGDTGNGDIEH